MPGQLDLFNESNIEVKEPEPVTTVRLGSRAARIPLRQQRREAVRRLMEILTELEDRDIYVGSYSAGGGHFWLENLKLQRLKVEHISLGGILPSVIVLWGCRGSHVRIFTDYLVIVREQEYQGYIHYLLDKPDR